MLTIQRMRLCSSVAIILSFIQFSPVIKAQIDTTSVKRTIIEQDTVANMLDEIVVTACPIVHTVEGDEYLITNEMKSQSQSAMELLNQIHGIKLNRLDNSISIDNKSKVLLSVNGKTYSAEYIKSIHPDRITKVKVIKNPKGRYISEGYDAVVDIRVRNFDGVDLRLSNFAIVNPSYNEKKPLIMEQPLTSFTYTNGDWSVFGSYVYGNSTMNTPHEKLLEYGKYGLTASMGMDKYRYVGNSANAGLNYRISPLHELSVEFDYKYENTKLTDTEDFRNEDNYAIYNKVKTPTVGATMFYKGQIGETTNVYSELGFNTLTNKSKNGMSSDKTGESFLADFKERRNNLRYILDFNITLGERMNIKAGYSLNWKQYNDKASDFDYHDTRNKLWLYASYSPTSKLTFEAGTGLEVESISPNKTANKSHSYWNLFPSLEVAYTPSRKFNMKLSYISDGVYPTLSMLNPVESVIIPDVFSKGNPNVKSGVYHKVSLTTTLYEKLTFAPQFMYRKNSILSFASQEQQSILFSYYNVGIKQLSLPVTLDIPIVKGLNFSAQGAYYASWGQFDGMKKKVDGWWCGANLTCFGKWGMADFGYNRSLQKENTVQGFKETGVDSWTLTANKQWLGGRLSTMLTWLLPLKFGVSDNMKSVTFTDFYSERKSTSLKPYRNAIVIQLAYRFNIGKNSKRTKRNALENEERISGGFAL